MSLILTLKNRTLHLSMIQFSMISYLSESLCSVLMQNAFRLIGNLNYNLTMISDELGISTTQLSKYFDSYITIPPMSLTECLWIYELHSHELSRRNSSYLCILVDNERRTVWDVLDSRSKTALSLFFSNIPMEERLRVKYLLLICGNRIKMSQEHTFLTA